MLKPWRNNCRSMSCPKNSFCVYTFDIFGFQKKYWRFHKKPVFFEVNCSLPCWRFELVHFFVLASLLKDDFPFQISDCHRFFFLHFFRLLLWNRLAIFVDFVFVAFLRFCRRKECRLSVVNSRIFAFLKSIKNAALNFANKILIFYSYNIKK